jgi:hypothetical protein
VLVVEFLEQQFPEFIMDDINSKVCTEYTAQKITRQPILIQDELMRQVLSPKKEFPKKHLPALA